MRKIFSIVLSLAIITSNIAFVNAENTVARSASDADNQSAVEEARAYLEQGISVTDSISDYTASNGVTVSIRWTAIYDNTIADEKGKYLDTTYMKADGRIIRPKWYEGEKRLKCNAEISAGSVNDTMENINVTVAPPAAPDFDAASLSNYIDIGDAESESAGFECVRDNGIQTNVVDDVTHTYRTLNRKGAMALTMKCEPEKTNYLTVKLWGNDTGNTMLWLCDPVTGNMNLKNDKQPTRTGDVDRSDWVELNCLNEEPQYNGGFIYSTYMIPEIYTRGKEYVSLRLYSTGGNADYSSVSIKEQTNPSRGIYAAYMTQNSNFDPSEFEAVTGKLAETADASAKSYNEQKSMAYNYARSAIETFKSWQIYGQDNYPTYMEGMVTRRVDWKNKNLTDEDWKNVYYQTNGMLAQNMTPLNMYEIFAVAYNNAGKLGYNSADKEELLARIVAGIDFLVRAQGADGGFFSKSGWIGGPERGTAGGNNLTGFGLRSVAAAMIDMYDEAEKSGLMDEKIDSDADGKLDKTRKAAWEQMAANARDYLVSLGGGGHAPNQDMADIIAALRFEKSLQIMKSSLAWTAQNKEYEIENQLDMALGFKPSLACSSYWVSPKGLILENFGSIQGGYSGDYGTEALEEMSQLVEFAEKYLTADKAKKYTERMENAYKAIDNFMFTANSEADSKPRLYAEGIVGYRWAHYPGSERYVLDFYNAVSKKNKTALKTFDYFFKHNKLELDKDIYYPSNAHFEDNALAVLKLWLNFDGIVSALNTENIGKYEYLMENDSVDKYAWADEMARDVVIKNGEDKIYIALNWRNPIHTAKYNTAQSQNIQKGMMNNLARVHHKTDRYDKYGYAKINTEGWNVRNELRDNWQLFANHYAEAFMYMDYGEYKIIMNSNNLMGNENDISYSIPWKELELEEGAYTDLVSGKAYYFGKRVSGAEDGTSVKVPPATTMVLYKADEIKPTATPTVPPTAKPTATPTVPPTVKPEITEEPQKDDIVVSYDNEKVTIALNDENRNEEVFVYAAEYNSDGALVKLHMEGKMITGMDKIEFKYQRETEDNKVRIFIWNSMQEPLCESREYRIS
ncbi:MAG: hypothetical protein Q4G33_10730 [bacterium]|nr:hypothetical protein [bacterium]